MSYQAIGAVQLHSRYRSEEPENFAPYKIMGALAWYANSSGLVGVAGEPRKCLGHRRIAEHAGVHRNTVGNWIPLLCEQGELSIVDRGGTGRGHWTVYQLHLPMVDDVPITKETPQPVDVPINLMPIIAEMAQAIQEMAHQLAQVKDLMAQGNGTNGTRPQSNPGLIRITDPDPILDPEEGNTPPPLTRPKPRPYQRLGHGETAQDLNAEYVNALAGIAKQTLYAKSQAEFEDTAYVVFGFGASLEDVAGFGPYWEKFGYYDDKPALKTIVDHWHDYKAGRDLRRKNGRDKPTAPAVITHGLPEKDIGGVF